MADASGPRAVIARLVSGLRERAGRGEPAFYALFAGACTLYVACLFYGSLRLQTLYSRLWLDPASFAQVPRLLGDWSAPLDDVFIHFDFARATARGYPFQWSEGNGYSSGGTSLLYPFVLAFGYWIGLRKLELVLWAGIVACTSTFALLLASRRLFGNLPRFTSYLAPAALLSVGVLGWNLFSGMEVAFLLALWGGAFLCWDDLVRKAAEPTAVTRRFGLSALSLGLWGAALVLTRPEAMTTVGVLSLSLAFVVRRHLGGKKALFALFFSAAPGALCVVAHSITNFVYTGEAAAAGALTKLELYDPYLTAAEIRDEWWGNFRYQFERLSNYHLAAKGPYGWIPWFLAAAALVPRATRRYAALLWATALSWIVFVALNGQVRWQNERYTMPALAWMLLAASLGTGALLTQVRALGGRARLLRAASAMTVLGAVCLFSWHARPRFVEQVWFFGRASRNILDQHLRTGWLLRTQLKPKRVLISDAGAIPYMSDLPALDLIGLGGYHRLPFARASQLGVGAAIELIERMPPTERPDLLAIYPHWWGELPLWFGQRIPDGSVSVRGNVICAGQTKVLYRADWAPLEGSSQPIALSDDERVVDSLDVADVLSERAHDYELSSHRTGHVSMKLLSHPRKRGARLWDAGRIVEPGASESFELGGFLERQPARLLFRVAPAQPTAISVAIDGEPAGELRLMAEDGWSEKALELPAERVRPRMKLSLHTVRGERILYHLFAVQGR